MDKLATIRRDSQTYRALHRKVHETLRHRDGSRAGFLAWQAACEAFHYFESPMLDLMGEGLERLSAGDPETTDWAVAFLEVDPFHFRSGYDKTYLIRRLKRLPLTFDHKRRLRAVVLRILGNPRRVMRHYRRLAASVQSEDFLEYLRWRLESPEPQVRQRAQELLDYLDAFNRTTRASK